MADTFIEILQPDPVDKQYMWLFAITVKDLQTRVIKTYKGRIITANKTKLVERVMKHLETANNTTFEIAGFNATQSFEVIKECRHDTYHIRTDPNGDPRPYCPACKQYIEL